MRKQTDEYLSIYRNLPVKKVDLLDFIPRVPNSSVKFLSDCVDLLMTHFFRKLCFFVELTLPFMENR